MLEWIRKATLFQLGSIFFGVGFGIYFFSLFNGFVADDNVYILANPQIRNFDLGSFFLGSSYYSGDVTQLTGIYFKPLFTLITSALFNLSGGTPFLLHLVQVLIHCTNSFLLFLLFSKFFSKQLAFFLGIIFLVHPGNVESVVYIADLQDVLYFLFGISALLLVFAKEFSYKRMFAIGLLLLSALLSKETGVLFLPTIVLLTFLKNKKLWGLVSLISGLVFAIYLFMRFVVAQVSINHQAIAPIMEASFFERLLTLPRIIFSYILLFLFPLNLSWGQHWVVKTAAFLSFYAPLLVILGGLGILGLLFFRLKQSEKGGFLFFFSVIILGIGLHSQILVPLDFTFAERWAYFSFMGFLGLIGVFLSQLKYLKEPKFLKNQQILTIFILLLILTFSIRTFIRTLDWKDDFTLSSHDIKVDQNSLALENNLGFELMKRSQFNEALPHLEKSASLYVDHSSLNNLAFTYAKLGDAEKSLEVYQKALAKGDHYLTYQNYIAELIRQKKLDEAKNLLNVALQKYPNNPKIYLLLAVAEYNLGNKDQAILAAKRANYLSPGVGNMVLLKIQKNEPINL